MIKKDWIAYFETVHGRKPSPQELKQAIADGEVSQELTMSKPPVKRFKWWFIPAALFIGIGLSFAIHNHLQSNISSDTATNLQSVESSSSATETEQSSTIQTMGTVQETSTSTEETQSATSMKVEAMDIEELMTGDFSSVEGEWSDNFEGHFSIDSQGMIIQGALGSSSNAIPIIQPEKNNSAIWAVLDKGKSGTSANQSDYIIFVPAGVTLVGQTTSDSSQDRIILGDYISQYNDPYVYYRVQEKVE
ncbi:hypothetical protein K6V43_10420 [Streptococcus suis]|nr:hypothetical protein [Streptococcus suis]